MAALPSRKDSSRSTEDSPVGLPSASFARRPCVLVVEDHEDTRFMLRVLLESRGLEVTEAANGESAISLAERQRPHLILMDGSLPLLDGFATTSRLRESEALRNVPVVFLSGHAEADYRQRAQAVGGDDYLIKPIDTAQLDRVLERYLYEQRRTPPALPAQET